MEDSKIKVLYIAGEGRSGSTILGAILGEIQGFLFVGELMSIWKHFFIENNLCTCGYFPSECSVWKPIIQQGFGTVSKQFAITMERYRKFLIHNRRLINYFIPSLQSGFDKEKSEYIKNLEHLYYSIKEINNTEFIIDDSKKPTYGKLLEQIETIDLYVLHLVRDPRAVAFSWQRKKMQTDGSSQTRQMYQFNPIVSAYRWNIHNFAASYLFNKENNKYYFLRYEDFIKDPKQEIINILKFLNITDKSLPFVNNNSVNLSGNHAVWGNPVRYKTGVINLINDNEWIKSFEVNNRVLVELLTYPLRKKYGYI